MFPALKKTYFHVFFFFGVAKIPHGLLCVARIYAHVGAVQNKNIPILLENTHWSGTKTFGGLKFWGVLICADTGQKNPIEDEKQVRIASKN